ncbi:hypothetical protein NDU88_005302 [Pleurodeles waltl]|uniref:Uncharacterized protein n=1 Tax=Pleurodeles waltl TaxID=8319 RepID=A0AAV7VJG7_PLEWA|nr:hypothetical protein NDU88_005302 [Pleurodeles waltl]
MTTWSPGGECGSSKPETQKLSNPESLENRGEPSEPANLTERPRKAPEGTNKVLKVLKGTKVGQEWIRQRRAAEPSRAEQADAEAERRRGTDVVPRSTKRQRGTEV